MGPRHPTSPPLGPGDVLDDRYEIVRLLGEGGFGVVYEARQLSTGQRVAIKLLRRERLEAARDAGMEISRFRRELEAIATLRHPGIVQLIDSGTTDDDELFAVLGFIEGASLADVLATEGPLRPAEAVEVFTRVADALAYAHGHGIIHRDLKPANIMLTGGGTGQPRHALVVDFGIAALHGPERAQRTRLTGDGQFPGTPGYMSPEQLRAEPVTPQADLYSWGVTLFEALTGRPAFESTSVAGIIFKQLSGQPLDLPAPLRSSPLGAILTRATACQPNDRYRTATELLHDLAGCRSGLHDGLLVTGVPRIADEVAVAATQDASLADALTTDQLGPTAPLPAITADDARGRVRPADVGVADDLSRDADARAPGRALGIWIGLVAVVIAVIAVALFATGRRAADDAAHETDDDPPIAEVAAETRPAQPQVTEPGAARTPPDDTTPARVASAWEVAVATRAGVILGAGRTAPARLADERRPRIVDLAVSRDTSCVLLADGRVRCWGDGSQGGLGPAIDAPRYTAVRLVGLRSVSGLAGGPGRNFQHIGPLFCAVSEHTAPVCWGQASSMFGGSHATGEGTLRVVSEHDGMTQLAHYEFDVCARTAERVRCWGGNSKGQFGTGQIGRVPGPSEMLEPDPPMASPLRDLALISTNACVLDGDGVTWCAGRGDRQMLGAAYDSDQPRLVRVDGLPPFIDVAGAGIAFCGVPRDGSEVVCWGNLRGQPGREPLAGTAGTVSLHDGADRVCGIRANGTVWCWSTEWDVEPMTEVALPAAATDVAVSRFHGCALLADAQRVYCWGRNDFGQLGDGTAIDAPASAPVQVVGALVGPDEEEPVALTVPSSVPVAASAPPVAPTSLPEVCVADATLRVRAPGDASVVEMPVVSAWLFDDEFGRRFIALADHADEPELLVERPRAGQARVLIALPTASGAPVEPGVVAVGTQQFRVSIERGPAVRDFESITANVTATGELELTHVDEAWVCGTVDIDADAGGKQVRGRFVAARSE